MNAKRASEILSVPDRSRCDCVTCTRTRIRAAAYLECLRGGGVSLAIKALKDIAKADSHQAHGKDQCGATCRCATGRALAGLAGIQAEIDHASRRLENTHAS